MRRMPQRSREEKEAYIVGTIRKYLAGEITEEDVHRRLNWLRSHGDLKRWMRWIQRMDLTGLSLDEIRRKEG